MKRFFFICKYIVILGFFSIFTGCGIFGDTNEQEPISIDLTISASEKLNPDIENRASPIVLRLYQLAQIDIFNNSDFFALYENDQNLLAKDLKYREELEIKPGQSSIKALEINPTTKYIAVLAAFRDLDKAQWKSFMEIDLLNPQPLNIELGEFTVKLNNTKEEDTEE